MEFVHDDECVEVTPDTVRLRKVALGKTERLKAGAATALRALLSCARPGYKVPRMNRSMKRSAGFPAMACLALILSVTAVSAGAAAIHFEKETLRAYEGQLHKGEVHAVTFHPGTGTGHMHVSLNNGGHMTVEYPASQQAKLVAAAQAANTPVKVATVKAKKAAASNTNCATSPAGS